VAKDSVKNGHWAPEEDLRLCLAVKAFPGRSWTKIQEHIEGRTDVKCRERFMNKLNPDRQEDKFTASEDLQIIEYVNKVGLEQIRWADIAKQLHPRTDNQCWRRWQKIASKEDLDRLTAILKSRQQNLVRNVVPADRSALSVREVLGEEDMPQLTESKGAVVNAVSAKESTKRKQPVASGAADSKRKKSAAKNN
jgi:hypothetical protein